MDYLLNKTKKYLKSLVNEAMKGKIVCFPRDANRRNGVYLSEACRRGVY